jgi:uncharacterized DUF497 family protein
MMLDRMLMQAHGLHHWRDRISMSRDTRNDYGEVRVRTVGFLRRRIVMVVWTKRGRRRRIISMRRCNEKEQKTTAASSRRDRDGWLVGKKTGALIGPHPHIERVLTDKDLKRVRVMGRPPMPEGQRRKQISVRWAPDTIEALKARGPNWSNWAEDLVKRALRRG